MPQKIQRPNPKKGTIFIKKYKKKEYRMEVIENNGIIEFKVNNKIYKSPTAAAKSITNNEVNGWYFWKMN